jgi:hypothetical protein
MANNRTSKTTTTTLTEGMSTHGERITVLERGVQALTEALHELGRNVTRSHEQLTASVEENREASSKSFQLLSERLASIGKPNYGTIFAGVTVLAMLVLALATPVWTSIHALQGQDVKFQNEFTQHEKLDIHPVAKQMFTDQVILLNERQVENDRRFTEGTSRLERRLNQERELSDQKLKDQREIIELEAKLFATQQNKGLK